MSRELDEQVAEALGLELTGWENADPDPEVTGWWHVYQWGKEKQPTYLKGCVCDLWDELTEDRDGTDLEPTASGHLRFCLDVVPFYSSDIALAWGLGEHLAGDEVTVFIETLCDLCGVEEEMLYWDGKHFEESIEALNRLVYATPEQRCHAFLAAKEYCSNSTLT